MAFEAATPDEINAVLTTAGKLALPAQRAANLSAALASCIDSQDIEDRAARTRDGWLVLDFWAYSVALNALPAPVELTSRAIAYVHQAQAVA